MKIKRFTVRRVFSSEKGKCVDEKFLASASEESIGQSIQSQRWLFKEIRHVVQRSPKLSQQKPVIEMKLSRNDLWRILVSTRMNPMTYMGDSEFLRIF